MKKHLREIDKFIDGLPTTKGALIATLHRAQELIGYLPEEAMQHIAKRLNLPDSKVFGVVSFYSFFSTEPKGRAVVSVCMGTACFVRGAAEILEEFKRQLGIDIGRTTADGAFTLDSLRCVGACGLAPVVTVNGKVYGRVVKADVAKIIGEYRN